MAIRYPSEFSSNTPETDYIKIQFLRRDYKSESVEYFAEGETIILNMPQRIGEGLAQNFANSGLGELGMLNAFGNRQGGPNNPLDISIRALQRISENTALNSALDMMNKFGASQLSENGILSGAAGIVFNPQLEVLYEGPDFRRFNFQFSLLTKSSDDARAIKSIVDELRLRSLPSTGSSASGDASGTHLGNLFATVGGFDAAAQVAGTAASAFATKLKTGKIDVGKLSTELAGNLTGSAGLLLAGAATSAGVLFSGESRFIKQPPFIYLQYMRGPQRHPFIPSLLPASLNKVDFDFTPSGNYTQLANYAEARGKKLATTVGVNISIQLTEVTNLFQESLVDGYQPREPVIKTRTIRPPGPAGQATSPAQTLIQPAGPGPTQPSLGLPGA